MADEIASLGFSIDSSGLTQGNAALDQLTAKANEAAVASERLTTATTPAGAAVKELGASVATTATATSQADAAFAALTAEMATMTTAATASALSLQGIKAYAAESSAALALLSASHSGVGSSARAAAEELGGFNVSAKEVREGVHLLSYELESMGASVGGLRGIALLARGGIELLAVAVAVGLVIEFERAGDAAEALHGRIDAAFGKGSGAFDELSASAKRLGTSVATIEPGAEAAYSAMLRIQAQGDLLAKSNLQSMGFGFAPGAAGKAAQDALVALNPKLDPQSLESLQKLTDLFRLTGETAMQAEPQAKALLAAIPTGATGARQAAETVNEEMVKLFQTTGDGSTAAGKSAADFFAKVLAGGLTAKDVAALAPEVGNELAKAFGYGEGGVEKFEAALAKIGNVTFPDFIAVMLGAKPAIDALEVKPSITDSWEKLVDSVRTFAGISGGGSAVKAFLDKMTEEVNALSENWDAFTDKLKLGGLISGWAPPEGKSPLSELSGLGLAPEQTPGSFGSPTQGLGDFTQFNSTLLKGAGWLLNTLNPVSPAGASELQPPQGAVSPIPVDIMGVGTSPSTLNSGQGLPVTFAAPQSSAALTATEQAFQAPEAAPTQAPDTGAATSALDMLSTGLDGIAGPADSAASGLSSVASAAGDVAGQAGELSGALGGIGGALSGAAAAVDAAVAQIQAAAASAASSGGGGGGGSYGDQTGIQAGAPIADIGGNADGGIYAIGGSGGADSIPLRGMVSANELVAVIPPGKATDGMLSLLQQAIGSSPISLGGADPAALTIGSPDSFAAAEAAAAIATGTVVNPAGGTGNALKLTPAQIAAGLALAAGRTPVATATSSASGGSSKGGGASGGGFKGSDPFANDPYSFSFPNPDPWAGFSGDPFKSPGGAAWGGGAASASRAGAGASGMVHNPDGSWSPAGMGHATAPSISGMPGPVSGEGAVKGAGAVSRVASSAAKLDAIMAAERAGIAGSIMGAGPSISNPDMGPMDPFYASQGRISGQGSSGDFYDPFTNYSGYGTDQFDSVFTGAADSYSGGSFDPYSFDPGAPYDTGGSYDYTGGYNSIDAQAPDYSGYGGFDPGGSSSDYTGDYSQPSPSYDYTGGAASDVYGGYNPDNYPDVYSGAFATGGSFKIPGSGATDSVPVRFMATPGERVTIETPEQQLARQYPGALDAPMQGFADGGSFIAGAYGFGGALGSPSYGNEGGGVAASPLSAPSPAASPGVFGFGGPAGGSSSPAGGWYSSPAQVYGFGGPAGGSTQAPAISASGDGGGGGGSPTYVFNVTTPPEGLASFAAPASRLAMRRTAAAVTG
ncbi:MAG: hypothetical protein JWP25_8956 [Bradyrhizobium sp.]|nr:hypothetical protein [Bradyrhizobium sp.]